MARPFGIGNLIGRGSVSALGVASAFLVMCSAHGAVQPDCREAEPADRFSERIDALLTEVEGAGFPAEANLESWPQRRGDIQTSLGEMLALAATDPERRRATVELLIAARSIAASSEESSLLGKGAAGGELRAWARRVLKDYYALGATRQDGRFLDTPLISSLKEAWADDAVAHPQRIVPFYQEKAAALRGLARFQPSPSCE